MPYRDRAQRLAYMRRYHERVRPAPTPRQQDDPELPPFGALLTDDDGSRVQCHVCGRWYRGLQTHIRTHGLDAASYKERYGLARGLSLWSPQYQERQRQAALARGQGETGRRAIEGIVNPRQEGIDCRLSSRIRASEHSARRKPRDESDHSDA